MCIELFIDQSKSRHILKWPDPSTDPGCLEGFSGVNAATNVPLPYQIRGGRSHDTEVDFIPHTARQCYQADMYSLHEFDADTQTYS